MRTYTVITDEGETVYEGFNKSFDTPHRLILVKDEYGYDVWAIDGNDGHNNLVKFISDEECHQTIVGVYTYMSVQNDFYKLPPK